MTAPHFLGRRQNFFSRLKFPDDGAKNSFQVLKKMKAPSKIVRRIQIQIWSLHIFQDGFIFGFHAANFRNRSS